MNVKVTLSPGFRLLYGGLIGPHELKFGSGEFALAVTVCGALSLLTHITVALYPIYTVATFGRYVCEEGVLGLWAPCGMVTTTIFSWGPIVVVDVAVVDVGATVG